MNSYTFIYIVKNNRCKNYNNAKNNTLKDLDEKKYLKYKIKL